MSWTRFSRGAVRREYVIRPCARGVADYRRAVGAPGKRPDRTPPAGRSARPSTRSATSRAEAGPERDPPGPVARGDEDVVAPRRAAQQRPPVRRQRPRARAHGAGRRVRQRRARSARRARAAAAPAPRRPAARGRNVEPSAETAPAVTRLKIGGGSPPRATSCSMPASSSACRGGASSRTSATTPQSGAIGRQAPVGSTSRGVHGPAATTTARGRPMGAADRHAAGRERRLGAGGEPRAGGGGACRERERRGGGPDRVAGVQPHARERRRQRGLERGRLAAPRAPPPAARGRPAAPTARPRARSRPHRQHEHAGRLARQLEAVPGELAVVPQALLEQRHQRRVHRVLEDPGVAPRRRGADRRRARRAARTRRPRRGRRRARSRRSPRRRRRRRRGVSQTAPSTLRVPPPRPAQLAARRSRRCAIPSVAAAPAGQRAVERRGR